MGRIRRRRGGQGRQQGPLPRRSGDGSDAAIALTVIGQPDLGPAPQAAAGRGDPDLQPGGGQGVGRLENHRRIDVRGHASIGRAIAVQIGDGSRRHPIKRAGHVLGGDLEQSVTGFLDAGDAHRIVGQADGRLGDRHDVHGLQQRRDVVEIERIGGQHAQNPIAAQIGGQLGRARRGQEVPRLRAFRTHRIGVDMGRVLGHGRAGVVIVGAVQELDGELVVKVGRIGPRHRHRRLAVGGVEIIQAKADDRRQIARIGRRLGVAIGNHLQGSRRPHGLRLGGVQPVGQEIAQRRLAVDGGRQAETQGGAPSLIDRQIGDHGLRQTGPVSDAGQDVGDAEIRAGVRADAGRAQTGDLEGIVGQIGRTAQIHVGGGDIGQPRIAQGLGRISRRQIRPSPLPQISGEQIAAEGGDAAQGGFVLPRLPDAQDRTGAQPHGDAGRIGIAGDAASRPAAAALAAAARLAGLLGVALEIAVPDQVRRNAGGAIDDADGLARQRRLHLHARVRRTDLAGRPAAAATENAAHVMPPTGCRNAARATPDRRRPTRRSA